MSSLREAGEAAGISSCPSQPDYQAPPPLASLKSFAPPPATAGFEVSLSGLPQEGSF